MLEGVYSTLPTGWYLLGDRPSERQPAPRPWSGLGRELAWWVDRSFDVRAADAFCPHLGAHLGHCASMSSDGHHIQCGFHGWKFDHDGRGPRLESARATLTMHPTATIGDQAFAFLVAPGSEICEPWVPSTYVRSDDFGEPTAVQSVDTNLEAHQQVVLEGDFDRQHFPAVHDLKVQLLGYEFYDTIAKVSYVRPGRHPATFEILIDGISRRLETITAGPVTIELTANYISTGSRSCTARGELRVWAPTHRLAERAISRTIQDFEANVELDAKVWRSRNFDLVPQFDRADKLLVDFRRWCNRFYGKQELPGENPR